MRKAYRDDPEKFRRRHQAMKNCPKFKAMRNAACRNRRRTSLKEALRVRIGNSLRETLRGKGKCRSSSFALLGYTRDELRQHLERQFTAGMNWEVFMTGRIHIDHIVPLAAFDFDKDPISAAKAAWALPNLRPLWAKKNMIKNDRREFLL